MDVNVNTHVLNNICNTFVEKKVFTVRSIHRYIAIFLRLRWLNNKDNNNKKKVM